MDFGMAQAYGGLILTALLPIILGANASVKAAKGSRQEAADRDDEGESINSKDALLFPIIAGVVLCSLYVAFKYVDPATLNAVISWYLALAGVLGSIHFGVFILKKYIGLEAYYKHHVYKIEFSKNEKAIDSISFTQAHFILFLASLALGFANIYSKHFLLSNILGTIYTFNAISLLKLDSFRTGWLMLMGLFFYDIYFVFGTNVMVTVAQSIEAPVKMVWPKSISDSSLGMSMLGLGDIAIPGIFIALALRFDYYMATRQDNREHRRPVPTPNERYPKPYYYTCLGTYLACLILTIVIMHTFQAAQPALLYLSPGCSLSVAACALWRGELKQVLSYVDSATDPGDNHPGQAKASESQQEKAAASLDRKNA